MSKTYLKTFFVTLLLYVCACAQAQVVMDISSTQRGPLTSPYQWGLFFEEINHAGDGGHFHPTQTLTDLLTISHELGRLDNLKVGVCGDLKFGRTVHSLIAAMSRYTGIEFVLISPVELKLPSFVKQDYIKDKGIPYTQSTDLDEVIGDLDILYMTRVQRERFFNEEDYLRLKDSYILTPEKLTTAKSDMCILHPLPRVNEISIKVDDDPRACYFKQVLNGKYMRMALILKLLEEAAK